MQSIQINETLRLDPVTIKDRVFLYELKNGHAARASALVTKQAISWEDHVAWLDRTLARNDVEFYTIKDETGKRLGSWRYDFFPDHIELAMIIHPAETGRRLGTTVFNFCSDEIQERTGKKITGYIAEGNVPPMRYHIRAGYQLESYDAERRCYVWTRDRDAFLLRKSSRIS